MSSNANLKWQECSDRGHRRESRNAPAEANPPDAARGVNKDEGRYDESNAVTVEKFKEADRP